MKEFPIVSIICSCYNHENYVTESLNSIVNQTYPNIELIIVDDFSTDNSRLEIKKWLKSSRKIIFIENSVNLGITKSLNNAAKVSTGEYLLDFAADDLLKPNCIEELVKVHMEPNNENVSIVYSNVDLIDENGAFISSMYNSEMEEKIVKAIENNFYQCLLEDSTYICSVSGLYNKRIFEELNGYDENLSFEDFDYWIRATKMKEIRYVNKVLVGKRVVENSLGSGFDVENEYTKKLNISFYEILNKAFYINTFRNEYFSLMKRIYGHSKWTLMTFNVKYFFKYVWLFTKTLSRYLLIKIE
jgi:glycosyltransferase involved in cell wall biosynthesis